MKLILTVFVVSAILAGVLATASAEGVLDLSTLSKNTAQQATALPQVSPAMPTTAAVTLGGNVNTNALDLSTLGKKQLTPSVPATVIKGSNPVTITPMFSIRNTNITSVADTVYTLPQAVGSNGVYTPPIAIFGGA
jgi:hypothetical protein